MQEAEDQSLRFRSVRRSVGLLLGPAGAGHEEQFGVGPDGLLVRLGRLDAGHGGAAWRSFDLQQLDGRRARPLQSMASVQPASSSTIHGRWVRVSTASMRWR